MRHLNDSIIIKVDLQKIYKIASDVKKFPEFLKGYKAVQIIKNLENDKFFLKILFETNGQLVEFECLAHSVLNRVNVYEHITGPLKGLKVRWEFAPRADGTEVTIKHIISKPRPFFLKGIGLMSEETVALLLNKSAQNILKSLKTRCEL